MPGSCELDGERQSLHISRLVLSFRRLYWTYCYLYTSNEEDGDEDDDARSSMFPEGRLCELDGETTIPKRTDGSPPSLLGS